MDKDKEATQWFKARGLKAPIRAVWDFSDYETWSTEGRFYFEQKVEHFLVPAIYPAKAIIARTTGTAAEKAVGDATRALIEALGTESAEATQILAIWDEGRKEGEKTAGFFGRD